jgi:hypothetical protein
MAISAFNSSLGVNSSYLSSLQGVGTLNHSNVTQLSDRLFQEADGTIRLEEKPFAQVVGEQFLAPLINKIGSFISSWTQYLPSFPTPLGALAQETPYMPRRLKFPATDTLVSCLNQHPSITPDLIEKGITQAVAQYLAGREISPVRLNPEIRHAVSIQQLDAESSHAMGILLQAAKECSQHKDPVPKTEL